MLLGAWISMHGGLSDLWLFAILVVLEVTFSFDNARQLVRAAIAYVKILPSRPLDRATEPMQQLAKELLSLGEPLFVQWEERHGALLDQPTEAEPT